MVYYRRFRISTALTDSRVLQDAVYQPKFARAENPGVELFLPPARKPRSVQWTFLRPANKSDFVPRRSYPPRSISRCIRLPKTLTPRKTVVRATVLHINTPPTRNMGIYLFPFSTNHTYLTIVLFRNRYRLVDEREIVAVIFARKKRISSVACRIFGLSMS